MSDWISLKEVPGIVKGLGHRKPSLSTVYDWCRGKGTVRRGKKLKTAKVNGNMATTMDWLLDFIGESPSVERVDVRRPSIASRIDAMESELSSARMRIAMLEQAVWQLRQQNAPVYTVPYEDLVTG